MLRSLVEVYTDKCINEISNEAELSSSLYKVPYTQHEMSYDGGYIVIVLIKSCYCGGGGDCNIKYTVN